MTRTRRPLAASLLLLAAAATTLDVSAQRRPRPPVTPPHFAAGVVTKSLHIKTSIVDAAATTELTQVYHNPGRVQAEAIWVLPLPADATADHFTMTMNGAQVSGEILDAQRARSIYTDIVRTRRDPGLLEYMGKGCLRARVFPILPGQDMKIEVRYREVLPRTASIHQWRFPLRALQTRGQLPERTALDLTIRSKKPLKNVYSPLPGVDVIRKGDHEARVSLELSGAARVVRDLDVFYGVSEQAFGLDLLTHRQQGKDGYFVMMLSPKLEWDAKKALPKCISFVVDTSGSMEGEKIEQARGALRFFLQSLKPQDHFNVIPFSTEARPFFQSMLPATRENLDKALARTGELEARGGTNIDDALTQAAGSPRPEVANALDVTVFLTDGRPSVGELKPERILARVRKQSADRHRIFVFGVGDDVNSELLDQIAEATRGDRDYVRQSESIELKTSALLTKLSHPVMSDVKISAPGIEGFDLYPKDTPDLFRGSRLLVTGRYKGTGDHAIRLTGVVDGQRTEFVYEGSFPADSREHDFIPTLWAQRKVAMLLDNIRLNPKADHAELIHEIRRLGEEHGIVTPYSSALILEDGDRGRIADGRPPIRYRGPGDTAPPGGRGGRRAGAPGPTTPGPAAPGAPPPSGGGAAGPTTGPRGVTAGSDEFFMGATRRLTTKSGAIDYSLALKRLKDGKSVVAGRTVRRIADHTFHNLGGVWVDTAFAEGMEKTIRKVAAFSDEYFALLEAHKELARIFALGDRVIVVLDGKAIETTAAPEPEPEPKK